MTANSRVTPAFTKAYAALNKAQKQAVDTITGPVMVVAGPGTGKTQVLALRIACILKETDTPPNAILALTFTDAGVYAMRTRLVSLIGTAAYHVRIHTFHGFCNSLIQEHSHQFERLIGSTQITDIDSVSTLREVIDGLSLKKLKKFGDPYFFVTDIRSELATLKREAISPHELVLRIQKERERIERDPDTIHTKGAHKGKMKAPIAERLESLERTEELARVYEAYAHALRTKKLYDFDDMILETLAALRENPSFLQLVQEQFLYVLADEHQDANTAQNTLLELLTEYDDNPNLFLVGDDKQAIFSFQGASLAHFRGFKAKYPHATEITLTDAYRSGTSILETAHALMQSSSEHANRNPRLVSQHEDPSLATIHISEFSTEEHEKASVARRIQALVERGVEPHEIAIIYRNNKDAAPISKELHAHGVPHSIISNQNVLRDHTLQQFVGFLRTITRWGDDERFVRTLHAPFVPIDEHDIYKTMISAKRSGKTSFEVFRENPREYFTAMEQLASAVDEADARTLFDRCVRESGFLAYILGRPTAHDLLASLRGLGNTLEALSKSRGARSEYSLRDFVQDLDLYEEYDLPIAKDETLTGSRGVQLLTAHKSKGLEFTYVFIMHCRDKKWGNTRDMRSFVIPGLEKKDTNEDERRLLYVAITRAKLVCEMSLGRAGEAGAHYLPSVFLSELSPYVEHGSPQTDESAYRPEHIFAAPAPVSTPLFDTDFLRKQFVEQGLSATAINNYISCPWKYFYRNLVRVPEKMSPAALFGNAIHATLNTYFSLYARNVEEGKKLPQPSCESVLENFETELPKQGFFKLEKEEALARGKESLETWYKTFGVLEGSLLGTEMHLDVPLTVGGATGSIDLHGILDRLTITEGGELVVTDFKTGKPKTRGEVEGSTKNSGGEYKRQLEFYKLLLIEQKGARGIPLGTSLAYGQIEFIEPDAKGRNKREIFAAAELDEIALKNSIISICEEIYTFSFWGKECEDKDCEYCLLRKEMN